MEELGTGAGQAKLTFQIGSVSYHTLEFVQEDGVTPIEDDTSGWTFEFYVKDYAGAIEKYFNLTLGNGISWVTYSNTAILITVNATQSLLEEAEYYWELRRTDLNEPFMSGNAIFQYEA